MHKFDIYFAGELVAGQDSTEVKANIGRVFKLSGNKLEVLFAGKPVCIKTNINAENAGKYRRAFLKAGALIRVAPAGSKPPPPQHAPRPLSQPDPGQTEDGMQLLPTNTGSLIDTAIPRAEFDLSGPDQFSLSPTGALLQVGLAMPVFNWDDIEHVEVLPANTGSLEEFSSAVTPVDIPDITQLHTVDGGNLSDGTEQPAPVNMPSIGHLQAAPANTGTLKDCTREKTPVKLPDISGIILVD